MYKKPNNKNKNKNKNKNNDQSDQTFRIRLPRNEEVFGIVEQRLGGSRMKVRCMDGHTRICRIPGRMKRYLWVREGDIIIVEPWEFSGDEKGDVIYKYSKTQVSFLHKKNYLSKLNEVEEF